jgi:CheY-like chemotaxis protein
MNRRSVLAIDDTLPNLSIIRSVLEGPFEVYLAKSIEAASKILKTNKIDLILLDIEMPEMSGFDYLKQLQETPQYRGIPVIFASSHAAPDLIVEALSSGAKDFIVKPISTVTLLEKINAVFAD